MTSEDIDAQKKHLRLHIRSKIGNISSLDKSRKSDCVCRKIEQNKYFISAQSVMCYSSLPSELKTEGILNAVLKQGKKLFLPRVAANSDLECCLVCDLQKDLVKGTYGILEPGPHCEVLKDLSLLDFLIIPGLAFSRDGLRLGRGAGYYDRFLSRCSAGSHFVGICFNEQIAETIPVNEFDFCLNEIITDD